MYDYVYGVINFLIADVLHIAKPQNWLGQLNTTTISVIMVSVWHFLPFSILVLSNALKQIPEELIESAGMDGANGFHIFWSIKLPLMKSSLITLLIVRFAAAFKMFDSIYLLTKGGPGEATTTLPIWYYLHESLWITHFFQEQCLDICINNGNHRIAQSVCGIQSDQDPI